MHRLWPTGAFNSQHFLEVQTADIFEISLKCVLLLGMLVLMICACRLRSVQRLLRHDDVHSFADSHDSFLWTCVDLILIEDPKPEC